ncbi:MAG: hypothetical protein ACSI46_06375 [Gloeotrichia echinulata DVL01]|jgi:hypothetical protein
MKSDKLVLKSLTLLTFLYLLLVPFGVIKNKFDATDVVIIIVILLFNSGLIERLEKLEFRDGSLSIEINEIKKQQETQKDRISANTDVIKRLTIPKMAVVDNEKGKKEFYQDLVTKSELEHLQKLASPSAYQTTQSLQTIKQELRRLRTLGFIETLTNKEIAEIQDPMTVRDYVRLSERGTEFLKLIEEDV